jgi:type III secretory pathway lipoprotein EscJ
VVKYTEHDCQDAWHDVDNAATHATEFRQHREQYPRRIQATPEQIAKADALVASWRQETDRTLQRIEAMQQHNREREAVSVVLTANVVEAFLEAMR